MCVKTNFSATTTWKANKLKIILLKTQQAVEYSA